MMTLANQMIIKRDTGKFLRMTHLIGFESVADDSDGCSVQGGAYLCELFGGEPPVLILRAAFI
jgi:hypothetical protein